MKTIPIDEMMDDLTKLTKEQIGSRLKLPRNEIDAMKKEELMTLLIDYVKGNQMILRNIFNEFSITLALHPSYVEEYLGITKAERQRWTEQKKLKVVDYISFNRWGKSLIESNRKEKATQEYPAYVL